MRLIRNGAILTRARGNGWPSFFFSPAPLPETAAKSSGGGHGHVVGPVVDRKS